MSQHASSPRRFWILAAAWLAATSGAASVGRAQQVAGSIGASLTVLDAIAASLPRVTEFELGRDGIARIETTAPALLRTSPLIMVRVASPTTDSARAARPPMDVTTAREETRARYLVNVGGSDRTDRARPTALRVEYLIVAAGT